MSSDADVTLFSVSLFVSPAIVSDDAFFRLAFFDDAFKEEDDVTILPAAAGGDSGSYSTIWSRSSDVSKWTRRLDMLSACASGGDGVDNVRDVVSLGGDGGEDDFFDRPRSRVPATHNRTNNAISNPASQISPVCGRRITGTAIIAVGVVVVCMM